MIAEPYINRKDGNIRWFHTEYEAKHTKGDWQRYDVFEREKLEELGTIGISNYLDGYLYYSPESGNRFHSLHLIGYGMGDYNADSESSRTLKRAEFLKAVCEKERVEWLPKTKTTDVVSELTKGEKEPWKEAMEDLVDILEHMLPGEGIAFEDFRRKHLS